MSEIKVTTKAVTDEEVTRLFDVVFKDEWPVDAVRIAATVRGWRTHLEYLTAFLQQIRVVVDRQAEDEGLWGVSVFGTQPITEAYLQEELRHLHKVIEDCTEGLVSDAG